MVEHSGAMPRLLSHSYSFLVNFGLIPSNLAHTLSRSRETLQIFECCIPT